MATKKTAQGRGTFLLIPLGDGTFGYGRLLDDPNVAFYRYRTEQPEADLDKIAASPIAFTIASRTAKTWEPIGRRELEEVLLKPVVRFSQDRADFRQCTIYDNHHNVRNASPEECEGLEPAAVWEPSGVVQRLLDVFAGRPNEDVEHMKVRRS